MGARGGGAGRAIVLYDLDCGWCRWTLAKFLAWDRYRRLRPVALQGSEADALLSDMPHGERMASWHLVTDDEHRFSGGAALAPLLTLLPGGSPLARCADALPRIVDRSYRWVAEHRSPLGRRLRRSWVERADARIRERSRAVAAD
jgi:predicted DCC family thiol-disulfide oxidoreductase YuxK